MTREKVLERLVISRNKLIEELLTELPLSDRGFQKALKMRDDNYDKDKEIWAEMNS